MTNSSPVSTVARQNVGCRVGGILLPGANLACSPAFFVVGGLLALRDTEAGGNGVAKTACLRDSPRRVPSAGMELPSRRLGFSPIKWPDASTGQRTGSLPKLRRPAFRESIS